MLLICVRSCNSFAQSFPILLRENQSPYEGLQALCDLVYYFQSYLLPLSLSALFIPATLDCLLFIMEARHLPALAKSPLHFTGPSTWNTLSQISSWLASLPSSNLYSDVSSLRHTLTSLFKPAILPLQSSSFSFSCSIIFIAFTTL